MSDLSVLRIMNETGDLKMTWSADNEDEVNAAREQFDAMKKKGFLAYKVKRDGSKGEVIRSFDPEAEMIIMSKPLAGG
jgi:hypothetical protein